MKNHNPFRYSKTSPEIIRLIVMMYVRLQKFVSIHASVFNHFNKVRHLNSRDTYKVQREAALIEWQQLCAA
jgi:hypothetical protein